MIISGGQTGVDRIALDVAIEQDLPHGGWCPKGRLAEDGRIPDRYQLQESSTRQYQQRTEANVCDSDGTLILHVGKPSGGTALTFYLANKHGKPLLAIDLEKLSETNAEREVQRAADWIQTHSIGRLNIAGPRASSVPDLAARAKPLLSRLCEVHQSRSRESS